MVAEYVRVHKWLELCCREHNCMKFNYVVCNII